MRTKEIKRVKFQITFRDLLEFVGYDTELLKDRYVMFNSTNDSDRSIQQVVGKDTSLDKTFVTISYEHQEDGKETDSQTRDT